MINSEIIKNIAEAVREKDKKTTAYDAQATVRRIEGNTAWVHIPGGVDETPVKLTINAQEGDTVQVRVSGGSAFITGNTSAPPTDDTKAIQVEQKVGIVEKVVTAVKEVADTAARIAGNTRQYFWFTSEGTDTGAHITEVPQDEFLADPSNGGGNLLARSNGTAIRMGLTELATFGASLIELGKNSTSSSVKMCGGLAEITYQYGQYVEDGILIQASNNDSSLMKLAELCLSALSKSGNDEENVYIKLSAGVGGSPVLSTISLVADTIDFNGNVRFMSATTWTAPTVVSNQATIRQGGYYSEGKRTYVQMEIRLASSLAEDTTLSEFLQGFPTPVNTLAVLSIATGGGGYGFASVKTNGKMNIRLNKTTGTSTNIYITGVYTTA